MGDAKTSRAMTIQLMELLEAVEDHHGTMDEGVGRLRQADRDLWDATGSDTTVARVLTAIDSHRKAVGPSPLDYDGILWDTAFEVRAWVDETSKPH